MIVLLKLLDEVASGKISLHSLAVLPAFGSKTSKTNTATSGIKDSEPVPSETLSESVVEKRTVSWAETASRGMRGDLPTLFTKSVLTIELIEFVIFVNIIRTGRYQERC
jgi:hypothetical protein